MSWSETLHERAVIADCENRYYDAPDRDSDDDYDEDYDDDKDEEENEEEDEN